MQTKETRGLVLYNRPFREDDKLVKIFTESSGKHMFFVRHAGNSKLSSVIQPLTVADFILKINDTGLSYIEDYKEVSLLRKLMPIFINWPMLATLWLWQMLPFQMPALMPVFLPFWLKHWS